MSFSSCLHWQVSIQAFRCKWQLKLLWYQVDQTKPEFRNGFSSFCLPLTFLPTQCMIQHSMKETYLWNFVTISTIQYTGIGIACAELPVTSVWIADSFSISSGKIAKLVMITSALAKFSQHRAQPLAPEVWLISATVFLALLKTMAFIFFLTCSELCWNLLSPHYVSESKTFLLWSLFT